MKMMTSLCFGLLVLAGTDLASAQALSRSECKEVLQTYGVLPSSCPTTTAQETDVAATTPQPVLEAPTQEMRQNNIFFTQGGDALSSDALVQLQRLANVLNSPAMHRVCLQLVGHSDSSGSATLNMEVGTKRAFAVREQLRTLLQNSEQIEVAKSMGETSPLDGLSPASAWQRRVEIWARPCPKPSDDIAQN